MGENLQVLPYSGMENLTLLYRLCVWSSSRYWVNSSQDVLIMYIVPSVSHLQHSEVCILGGGNFLLILQQTTCSCWDGPADPFPEDRRVVPSSAHTVLDFCFPLAEDLASVSWPLFVVCLHWIGVFGVFFFWQLYCSTFLVLLKVNSNVWF